jgi:uncharacterized protein YcbK (DUF882 family)
MRDLRATVTDLCRVASAGLIAVIAIWAVAPSSTESAAANGDTRTLHLYHTHTGETIDATFRVDGHYDPTVLAQLNHFLRDWRNNDEHVMDPRLFDAIWEAYRTAGATDRIQIYSAYRSPETNAMLRRRSRAVAEHSQHMLGKAMDTTMPGFPMHRIREAAMKLEHGGVGWYPSANFVHIDVGGVRSWPRMSYDQLAQLFPDGKTVHIAADGRTLPGYEQARLELASRGQSEVPPAQESPSFFAWLFGSGSGGNSAHEDEEDRRAPVAVASAAPPPAAPAAETAAPQPAASSWTAAVAPAAPATPPQPGPSDPTAPSPIGASSDTVADVTPTPLPPRRPLDLVAEADVPLPPTRPETLTPSLHAALDPADVPSPPVRPGALSTLVAATPAGLPVLRNARLPALITNGRNGGLEPREALAYAGDEPIQSLRARPLWSSRDFGAPRPLALRSAAHRRPHQTLTPEAASAPLRDEPSASFAGLKLTGLREAARHLADKSAL